MKGNRRQVEKAYERCREDVLTRMLLHVIAATVNVNRTVNAGAFLKRSCIVENVKNLSVVSLHHFGDAQSVAGIAGPGGKNPSHVKDLPTARGIEGGPIEDQRRPAIRIRDRNQIHDFGVEFVKKRVVVVKMFSHDMDSTDTF